MNSLINTISNFSPVTTTLIFGAIIILVFTVLNSLSIKYYFSPGPWGIPILGYYPFLPQFNQHFLLAELSKKYGDVYLINICGKAYVHLSSFKAIGEAFVTKSDCFSGRTLDTSIFYEGQQNGLYTLNGVAMCVWRKFLIQSIREVGFGTKQQLKHPIQEAVEVTLKEIKRNEGKPVNITLLIIEQCMEAMRRLMVGDNVSREEVQKFSDTFEKLTFPSSNLLSLLNGRVARCLASRKVEGIPEMKKAKKDMHRIFNNFLKDHDSCLNLNDPKDITDLFLRERKLKTKKEDPQVKYLTNEIFTDTLTQIYCDGGCTVGFILSEFVKDIAHMPIIQESIFKEIVENIGADALPTYEDQTKLPFTISVIKELIRTFNAFPVMPSLECSETTTVSGVHIPKGAIILINVYAINSDKTVYKNPEKFDPERFVLSKNAKEKKVNDPMLFGIGKRSCVGETLVMTEIFLFITAIIQKFKFHVPEKGLKAGTGCTNSSTENPLFNEYFIVATSRL